MLERDDLASTRSEIGKNLLLMYQMTFYCQEVIVKNPREGTKYLVGVTSRRL